MPFEIQIPLTENISKQYKNKIVKMFETGGKKTEIAKKLGITTRIVKYALKQHQTQVVRSEQFDNIEK
jgi:hypothetical protein